MRQCKVSGIVVLVLVLILGLFLPNAEVEAGKTTTILNTKNLTDATCWYCPNEDVLTENGILTFTDKSTGNTKYVSKLTIESNEDNEEFLVMECVLQLNKLPKGEKFVLGLGLTRLESSIGDANNIEVTFTNENGIKVGVYANETAGSPTTIVAPQTCGISVGQGAKVRISVTNKQVLNVTVAGKRICSSKIPVSGSGRIGFIQTGNCAAEIKELDIRGYKYDRPENTNVSEDFENGIDISKIEVVSTYKNGIPLYKPARVAVEECGEGNKALMFVNAGGYYFTTMYKYSNFEMTFDVPYLRLAKEVYEDERYNYFNSFGIAFGLTTNAAADWYSTDSADQIVFGRGGGVSSIKLEGFKTTLESHKYWEDFKPISVKLRVVDGDVTVGVKWVEETEYTTVGNYQLESGTPTGYIRFSVPDVGNASVDNLKITNLDDKPNVIETEYQSSLYTVEDAEYEPYAKEYANTAEDKEVVSFDKKAMMWYLLIPEAILIGAAIILVPIIIDAHKKKKAKGEKVNEA